MSNLRIKPIVAFLPCRKGSERVPRKNVKKCADLKTGLIELKLKQLIKCKEIKEIILSTNDQEIIKYATSLNIKKIKIDQRADELSSSETTTDELIIYAGNIIKNAHILWTHVTSPFINNTDYSLIIKKYYEKLNKGHDSLMTVTPIQSFIWNKKNPVNYDRLDEKWPRTQTLEPLYEVNSGVFISTDTNYRKFNDRIGLLPFMYKLDKTKAMDVDWPEDFMIAEQMYMHSNK